MIAAIDPGNGLFYSQPREWYDAINRLSATTLLKMGASQKHFKAARDKVTRKSSKALDFGVAFHHYILERDTFDFNFSVSKTCGAKIASGDRKGNLCGRPGIGRVGDEWRCGTHGKDMVEEENIVSPADMYTIERMADSLKEDPIVRLLRRRGGHEATILWEHKGVPLKSRLDKLILEQPGACIIDLKTVGADGGAEHAFKSDIAKYGYHIRAAMYVDAVQQVCGVRLPYIFVVCEKEPPYCIGTYQLEDEAEARGRFWYRSYLSTMKACEEIGKWRGWTDKIQPIGLPKYAMEGEPDYGNE